MKRVEVTWIDIRSDDGWRTLNKLEKFITGDNTVKQIGFLHEEDEEQIVLLDSYFEDGTLFGGVHTIPRGCIKSIIELKEI
jgi:hypothetical protein